MIARSRIDSLEATADALEADVNRVQRQGRFATVQVDVTSNGAASDGGGWSLGDALDDAERAPRRSAASPWSASRCSCRSVSSPRSCGWSPPTYSAGRREQALDRG